MPTNQEEAKEIIYREPLLNKKKNNTNEAFS